MKRFLLPIVGLAATLASCGVGEREAQPGPIVAVVERDQSMDWQVSYPRLTARSRSVGVVLDPVLAKLNDDIKSRVKLFTDSATQMACAKAAAECDNLAFPPNARWTLDYSVRSLQYRNIAVVLIGGYEDTLGNHPMDTSFSAAFNLRTGQAIVLDEVIDRRDLEMIAPIASEAVEAVAGPESVDSEWINEGVRDLANYATWWPSNEGLHVVFAAYSVVPWAAGTPEIVLPWRTFDPRDAAVLGG